MLAPKSLSLRSSAVAPGEPGKAGTNASDSDALNPVESSTWLKLFGLLTELAPRLAGLLGDTTFEVVGPR